MRLNNTLTGLGLALVLALLAALIGPWFVNWTAYRDDFAREASALVGAPVKVAGSVDARLLPSPYIRFRGLTAGAGATRSSIDEIEIELAMAPLLRGEFKAERIKLVRPKIGVEIAADGVIRTAFSDARKGKSAPGRVSFDRAEIADGAIFAKTPQGDVVIERIAGVAEAGSLTGPFRFEGSAGPANRRTEARLSTTRADASGQMRIKLALARDGQRETFEADGALKIAAKPGFDGRFSLARVATPAKPGQPAPDSGDEPWRIAGDVKADAARLGFEALDIAYGSDDRGLRMTGRGSATLGQAPRLDLALEARQIDLDRIAGTEAGEGRATTPAGRLAAFAARFPSAAPPIDGRVTLDVRGLVLAGDVVQDLRTEVETVDGGWRLKSASGRLPGDTTLAASGAVAVADGSAGFAGPVDFESGDLGGFRRWLSGGEEPSGSLARRLAVKGDVTARADAISIDNAEILIDGARSKGRVAWRAAGSSLGARARIEAALDADTLDLDALGVDRLASYALADRSSDLIFALDARSLTFAGVRMSEISLDATSDASGFDLKRLAIRNAGGASIEGSGRLAPGATGPEGKLGFHVEAPRLAPLIALARAGGAPEAALDALTRRAGAIAPVKLALDISADAAGARVAADGEAAGGQISAQVSAKTLSLDAPTDIDVKLASPDGRRLAALMGVEISPLVEARGGEIALKLSGAPAKGMSGEGRFSALGLDVSFKGAAAYAPVVGFSADGEASLKAADVSAIAEALGRLTPGVAPKLPSSLTAKLALSAEGARFGSIIGQVAGRPVSGRLAWPADRSAPFEGAIAVDDLPAAALAALALSPEALSGGDGRRSSWPSAAFGPSPARGLSGRLAVSARRLELGAGQVATGATFTLALRPNAIAVEKLAADLDGGALTGSVAVSRSGDDATVGVALGLEHARAERLLGLSGGASPLAGAVDIKVEAQGSGRNLAAVMGALAGTGTATLKNGALRGLDVAAIDRIEPLIEAGLPLEAAKVAEALGREFGRAELKLARAVAPFTLSAGVLRVSGLASETPDGRLGGGALLDLRQMTLDADLTLQPNRPDAPQITASFDGRLARPVRRIDATAFTGWLSVRAVERETRRIEAMEADIRERARIARLRADEEKKRADEEKRRVEEEKRKAEADRLKREAEARAIDDALPRPQPSTASGLPSAIDLSLPGLGGGPSRAVTPPAGVFEGSAGQNAVAPRTPSRARPVLPDTLPPPQSILPPAAATPPDR